MTSNNQTLDTIAIALTEQLSSVKVNKKKTQTLLDAFFATLPTADKAEVATAMHSLTTLFDKAPDANTITAAMICGYLAENGYDATPYISRLETVVLEQLEKANAFMIASAAILQTQVDEEEEDEEEDPWELIEALRTRTEKKNPNQVAAFDWLEKVYPCLISTYSTNGDLWQKGKEILSAKTAPFTEISSICHWLNLLFSVLFKEPVLVAELKTGKAFLGTISGIADNFQLQLLLMSITGLGETISAEQTAVVDGSGPQSTEISVAGKWDMCNWQTLSPLLLQKVERDSDYWIWSEGRPEDISVLDNRRVILLKPPSYQRGLPVQRSFAHLPAGIHIEKWLNNDELEAWLNKMKSV